MSAPRVPRLSRESWVDAALAMLAERGVDAVRVEPIARRLRVTKGSFYWHFRDRQDLLKAALRRWEEVDTLAIKESVEAAGGDAEARLRRLFGLALGRDLVELDVALRDWARRDPHVRKAVALVDKQRLAYLSRLFEELGVPPADAGARAFVAYAVLFGDFFIAVPRAPTERAALLERCKAFVLEGARRRPKGPVAGG